MTVLTADGGTRACIEEAADILQAAATRIAKDRL
jgi:hypothetical protein